jgi:hypothetical protein
MSCQALVPHVVSAPKQSREPGSGIQDQATSHRVPFASASTLEKATEVAGKVIVEKLANSLAGLQYDKDIDCNKKLQLYRVDSLLAVELGN